jgi:hypothetical protein
MALGIWKHGSFYGHPGTLMGFTTLNFSLTTSSSGSWIFCTGKITDEN